MRKNFELVRYMRETFSSFLERSFKNLPDLKSNSWIAEQIAMVSDFGKSRSLITGQWYTLAQVTVQRPWVRTPLCSEFIKRKMWFCVLFDARGVCSNTYRITKICIARDTTSLKNKPWLCVLMNVEDFVMARGGFRMMRNSWYALEFWRFIQANNKKKSWC